MNEVDLDDPEFLEWERSYERRRDWNSSVHTGKMFSLKCDVTGIQILTNSMDEYCDRQADIEEQEILKRGGIVV